MAQQVFAYIIHKDGVPDDTALEMIAAARRLDPDASVAAVVAGTGAKLDGVCNELVSSFSEVWKIDNEALAYVNAEVLRSLLVRILPKDGIVLIPHEHFGMDLAPGLSIKLDAAYLPDAVDFEGVEDGKLKAVREEYTGQVSTHVNCDISQGAVITVRPGSFKADESKSAAGKIVDKTAEAMEGGLPGGDAVFWKLWKPRWGTWISPSRMSWYRWAGASKTRITWRSYSIWQKPWARMFPAPDPSWMQNGWRNPDRWGLRARRSSRRSTWPWVSAARFSTWAASRALRLSLP